ncbi:MAG: Aspartate aminotransferase [Gemmatimonadaceae bacterium]|nr:Aspartate aminotransferase [Gemmatimonadaceae bacterium]
MSEPTTSLDVRAIAKVPGGNRIRLSNIAIDLKGSEILRIAGEIRAMVAAGESVCNLTVGDFDPRQFRIPELLEEGTIEALRKGETNYPPSSGLPALREAIQTYYERDLGIAYDLDSIVVTAGSRPGVYGAYRAIVSRGERVIYPVPSWNNNYYTDMVEGVGVPIETTVSDAFLPTRQLLEPYVRGARMIALNSPLNPCGTAFTAEALGSICDMILEENDRRGAAGRPLFLLYDQVYWKLTFGGTEHFNPVTLRPEMARYTVFIDGLSKAFAATGVRVGWVAGPTDVIGAMNNFLGHVGTWAPRAEQVAAASLLRSPDEIVTYGVELCRKVQLRLDALYQAVMDLKASGHPVDAVSPMGAIYLSARFNLEGKRARDGSQIRTVDDVRGWLLREAGLGVVPFGAFGASSGESGWFRLSVGAVSMADIEQAIPRLRRGLDSLG